MSAAKPHVCAVDYSAVTGSLVACTCGFALGPFMDRDHAAGLAKAHRACHVEPKPPTPESKARALESQAPQACREAESARRLDPRRERRREEPLAIVGG